MQTELHLPHRVLNTSNHSRAAWARIHRPVRIAEISSVECVERFPPKRQSLIFRDEESLLQRPVGREQTWPTKRIPAGITEVIQRRSGVRSRIEPQFPG